MGKGGGGSVTVAYRYYVSIHKALCHGPIDKVTKIQVDEKLAWVGEGKHGSHYIDNYDLFGGESREGGIQGGFDVDVGNPGQMPNPFLQKFLGEKIPAFRGVSCVILKDMYMGINPYLKKWWYRTQRIHRRSNNKPQWQDALSEINVYGAVVKPAGEEWEYVLIPQTEDNLPPMPEEGWQTTVSPLAGSPSGSSNWIPNHTIWARKKINIDPFRPLIFAGEVENGAHFFINGEHLFSINGENEQILENEHFVKYVDTRYFPKGENELQVCGIDEYPGGPGSVTYLDFSVNLADSGAMNPAHIIRECLTDVEWGMGYPEADMDEKAFLKAAVQLFNEGLGMCILWDKQQELQDFIGDILRHIDGSLYIDRKSGKFVLKLARDDWKEDLDSVLHLDESSVESVTNFKRPTFGELVNTVTVNYWDMALGADRSVTVTDIALAAQGGANASSIDFKGFPTAEIANRIAQRELSQLSTPLYTCSVLATTKADVLNIGDVFTLSWSDYGLENVRFRVSGIAYGDGKTNKVRIECVEDNFESPMFSTVTEQYPDWDDPIKPAKAIVDWTIFEAPYYMLVYIYGQDSIDTIMQQNPSSGGLIGLARKSDNAQKAEIHLDTFNGEGFSEKFSVDFSGCCEITEDLLPLQFEVNISNQQDIKIPTWGLLNNEFVKIVGVQNGVATIERGCLDSIPTKHSKGSIFHVADGVSNNATSIFHDGDSIKSKIQAIGFSNAAATPGEKIIQMVSRAARPYLPGKFSVNGELLRTSFDKMPESVVFNFKHRNKDQQTGKNLINFMDDSVTPSNSLKYVISIVGETADFSKVVVKSMSFEASLGEEITMSLEGVEPDDSFKKMYIEFKSFDEFDSLLSYFIYLPLAASPYNLTAEFKEG